ncbi:MAG: hypothetical protein K8S16_02365 [Bacteroidales bacterium]|nr:hypothetical protein [Bacteroidales bacterium]
MKKLLSLFAIISIPVLSIASEADLVIPKGIRSETILYWGFLITFAGFMFGLYQFMRVKKIRAHQSMLDVAHVIYETGKTYLIQKGKFLVFLFFFIEEAEEFFFVCLFIENFGVGEVLLSFE